MKENRKGNDIAVTWSLKRDGEPFNLEGLNLTLYLKSMYEKKKIEDFSVRKDKIYWTFFGKDQDRTGTYSLELVVNEGKEGMMTTDACNFVRLVSCSCKTSVGYDENGIQTEVVNIESEIGIEGGSFVVVDLELLPDSDNAVANSAVCKGLKQVQDSIPSLSEYAKKEDIHTPDWNAGEGEEGHILNRTHYADFVEVDIPEDIASSEAEVIIPHIVGAPILVHYRGYVTSKYLKIDAEDHELHVLSYGPAFKIRRGYDNTIYISGHNDENHRLYIATHFVALNEIFIPETIARKSEMATINGQPLTEGGDIVIEGGEGSYDDTEIQNKLTELSAEVSELSLEINGKSYHGSWDYTKGGELYQQKAKMEVDIPQGTTYNVTIAPYSGKLYYYINGVSKGYLKEGTFTADTDIKEIAFYLTAIDANGTLDVQIKIEGMNGILGDIENFKKDSAKIQKLEDEVVEITGGGQKTISKSWEHSAGGEIYENKTRLDVDIKKGVPYTINANYDGTLYYYVNGVSKGYLNTNNFIAEEDIQYFSFYLTNTTTSGSLVVQVTYTNKGRLGELEEKVEALEGIEGSRTRLIDVVSAWMNGEKFPIGFHGDSTTDGVSTTGWTVANSHPSQDEAIGGVGARGVVDYICELAYPKQLENRLRIAFNNNVLRVYNIGYYGASLSNNKNQLDAIYGGVYSDVKMVGIVLGINDRANKSVGEYYNHMVSYLEYYADWMLNKGITPFMVTNQVVNQNGYDPNYDQYSASYQDSYQDVCNAAKIEVARRKGLEVIDMNSFGRLVMTASAYDYSELTEGLHFKDLGHELEAGYLFSILVPWVFKAKEASVYFGMNCATSKTQYEMQKYYQNSGDKFKIQTNTTKTNTNDLCIFDAYLFNERGQYSVKYLTPKASGYLLVDGKRFEITSEEVELDVIDIGLHRLQVFTGNSQNVAIKGFLLSDL